MSLIIIIIFSNLLIGKYRDEVSKKFDEFVHKYNKSYKSNIEEYNKRLNIFQHSLRRIEWMNRQRTDNKSAYYGITEFSDLTPHEFEQIINKKRTNGSKNKKNKKIKKRSVADEIDLKFKLKDLPQKWDWRTKGVVTEIRNQGKCGACWAHSIVETIESMVAMKTKKLEEYSIQQLVDCAAEDNKGCDGGDTCAALVWMAENGVLLQSAEDYPLRDDSGDCRVNDPKHGVQISYDFTCDNLVNNEDKIVKLLATHGPLVIAVDAKSWQHYLGGVIQFHCEDDLNHAAQVVGYDLTGEIPYYMVRNTWDKKFGIDGYLHIGIGHNLCGIAEEVSSIDVILT